MTDADQASYWQGVAERALAKQHEYEAQLARAREALEDCVETLALVEEPSFVDPAHGDEVKRLGDRIGYGALMSSASASWIATLERQGYSAGGAFVAGPCLSTVQSSIKRARETLRSIPAPADGVKNAEPVGWVNDSFREAMLEAAGKVYWHGPMMCGKRFKGAHPVYLLPPILQSSEQAAQAAAVAAIANNWSGDIADEAERIVGDVLKAYRSALTAPDSSASQSGDA